MCTHVHVQGLPDNRYTVNLMEFCALLQDADLLRDGEELSTSTSTKHASEKGAPSEISVTVRVAGCGVGERVAVWVSGLPCG